MKRFTLRAFAISFLVWGTFLWFGLTQIQPTAEGWKFTLMMVWGAFYSVGIFVAQIVHFHPADERVIPAFVIISGALVLAVLTTVIALLGRGAKRARFSRR